MLRLDYLDGYPVAAAPTSRRPVVLAFALHMRQLGRTRRRRNACVNGNRKVRLDPSPPFCEGLPVRRRCFKEIFNAFIEIRVLSNSCILRYVVLDF